MSAKHDPHSIPAGYVNRFWTRVDRSGGIYACWPWTRGKLRDGYGTFSFMVDGIEHKARAHRAAYLLTESPALIPECVCHHCDNPGCCNPRHMFTGSRADNNADKLRKGRNVPPPIRRGETNNFAKLTEAKVLAIRAMKGRLLQEVADLFGISKSAVCVIQNRKRWSHVE